MDKLLFFALHALAFIVLVNSQCVVHEATTRLPSFIVPTSYNLHYTLPNPSTLSIVSSNSASFSGNVTITLEIQQTTTCIALHSYRLNLSSITLRTDLAGQLAPAATSYLESAQITLLKFAQALTPQTAQLTIAFSGNFNNQSASGFFLSDNVFDPSSLTLEKKLEAVQKRNDVMNKRRCEMKKEDSKELKLIAGQRKMYATQFEATAARYAYPSFDEPEFKAIFSLTATVTSDNTTTTNATTVLFNTPLASSTSGLGFSTFTFEPTPHPMSTYLVAIAVGEFEYVETTNGNGGVFRVYTPPGASQYADFALNVSRNVVEYFSKIWSFDYFSMIPKMDHVAVPAIDEDAMENWGLLTYYPGFLLVDAANPKTPLPSLQIVALVVVHEISHQWFGDTVTTPWWNEIFLNEGYARFLQYVGTDYLFPEWEIFTQGDANSYFNFAYLPALQADFMGLSIPIYNFSQTSGVPSIINANFGIIPYGKGAAINRMIASYLTMPVWNQVMAYHLQKHQFTNPSILDLMQSYDTVLDMPLSEHLFPYFVYTGFPVLTIQVNTATLELSQVPISRFGDYNPKPYWIHTNLQVTDSGNGTTLNFVVDFDTKNTTITLPYSGYWIVAPDANFTSYMLINYDSNTWNRIIYTQVMKMSLLERTLVVQSQLMFVQMALLDPKLASSTAFVLFNNFESVGESLPLYQSVWTTWLSLSNLFRYNSSLYTSILGDLQSSLYEITMRIGFSARRNDNADTRALRSLALFCGAYFHDIDAVANEIELYLSGKPLEEEQKKAVYWAVVKYHPSGYDSILQTYQNSTTPAADKPFLLFALLAPANITQCQTTLDLIIDDANFTTIQRLDLVSQMLRYNNACRTDAWEQYASLAQRAWEESGARATPTIISGFDGIFDTAEELTTVQAFLSKNEKYLTESQTSEIIMRIQINIQVVAKWG